MTTTLPAYAVDGDLLEVCSCNVLCPCWIGADPDGGTCDSALAYHFRRGQIRGVDVAGLTLVSVGHIPGNILQGNIRGVFFYDERATPAQRDAILALFRGELGGPLADLAALWGELLGAFPAAIDFSVEEGKGTLRVSDKVHAEMQPFRGPDGSVTTLHNSIFSTIPGSPAYVSKATHQKVNLPEYGFTWEFADRNAIQGEFHFEG